MLPGDTDQYCTDPVPNLSDPPAPPPSSSSSSSSSSSLSSSASSCEESDSDDRTRNHKVKQLATGDTNHENRVQVETKSHCQEIAPTDEELHHQKHRQPESVADELLPENWQW